MNVRKILLPVDGSQHSKKAATAGADLARQFGAEVTVLFCYNPFYLAVDGQIAGDVAENMIKGAEQVLDDFTRIMDQPGVNITKKVLEGDPGEMISELAQDEDYDMIVMGSRGRSDLAGLFLGSVTHRVLQTSPCPVLVIR